MTVFHGRRRAVVFSIWSALLLTFCAINAEAAKLQVHIAGIKNAKGNILVAVCRRDNFLSQKCAYDQQTPATAGEITVIFEHIPPGVYAVQAFDDTNGNGKLDRNWLGWPKEGMGFSNDAPMHHGPPSYNDAAIRLGASGGMITFHMKYY